MLHPINKMNRNLGRLLAVLFGLTLFFEVACLPLISSYALQVEKSMVAEVDVLDEKETEKGLDLFQYCAPLYIVAYQVIADCVGQRPESHSPDALLASSIPVYLRHCSIRI
jgi:hypothetical protein